MCAMTQSMDQSYGSFTKNQSWDSACSYMYLYMVSSEAVCQVCRTSYMGAQHAQRVVVKRNTCTDGTCNNTQRVGTSNQWPVQTCITAV